MIHFLYSLGRRRWATLLLTASALVAFVSVALPADADRIDARAMVRSESGQPLGLALFEAQGPFVKVTVKLRAPLKIVSAGFHGFHIHENGTCRPTFAAAGGHYNPTGAEHGSHAGDLPSPDVMARGRWGLAHLTTYTDNFRIRDVVGKAVILHADRDNFNNVPVGDGPTEYTPNSPEALELTTATGNAGARVGCGVIRWQ